ncbi:hypothetical protein [Streptomyces inhibens]|uniref:hypothetical protein n=1 Tax=Streptomyces inhibens TaxID=2293571 RepID=UPI001EE773DA|nr:hypothetical protein [Streptomyces inhibens]UKY52337.1 hypothetical protein KI385_28380 [Streptomyces inhibens]
MKQGTIKTLGVAALGAAFAVTAAGAANAAQAIDTAGATGVLKSLPVQDATKTVSGATKTVSGVTKTKSDDNKVKTHLNSSGNKLLGGLPTSAVAKTLPLGG